MIKIIGLNKDYDFAVLQNINLQLPDKGFIALVGESGSGKSTLLKCIGLLEKPTSGEIWYAEKKLSSLNPIAKENMRGKILSYISQSTALIEDETVDKGLSFFQHDSKIRLEVLKKLSIEDKKDEIARNLSGGERQRVAIAQALLRDTPVLLCDEITANLDPKNAEEVHKILKEISKSKLVLCVGHNPEMLNKYADRMISLKEGKVCKDEVLSKDFKLKCKDVAFLGKKTSIGIDKFFKIFSWGIKAKLARIIFCALFIFFALTGFCFGITQIITGSDGLIRKQAEHLGIEFVKINNYQKDSYMVANSIMANDWRVFVDFDTQKDKFELLEGEFPSNEYEVIISEFKAKYEKIEVGDEYYIAACDDIYKISGIFKSDLSSYTFDKRIPENFSVYPTLDAVYFSKDAISYYEKNVLKAAQDSVQNLYIEKYEGQSIIAGNGINSNNQDGEILVSTGYITHKYGYTKEQIIENPQSYFDQLNKEIQFNGHNFTIVGLCDNDTTSFLKAGDILYLDRYTGFVLPVSEVNKNNFYNTMFVTTAISYNNNWTKIGMTIFGVFAVLSVVLFVNLNLFEIDEKKVLFRNMRQAGFSKHSLTAYVLIVDILILVVAFIFFLLISVPIIAHFQLVQFTDITSYIYVFSGWSILISLIVMMAVAIISYLCILNKFDKEISVCSKL